MLLKIEKNREKRLNGEIIYLNKVYKFLLGNF